AFDGLRVATWNITNYSSGRVAAFRTAIYDSYQGRSMAPDVLICQELLSQSGVNNFLNILNGAAGSPGDWAAAPYINGNDTDNAFFYRTSKVTFLGVTTVVVGGGPPNPPRDVQRYDVRLVGYTADEATIAMYSSHMKAGTNSSDQDRRLLEAQMIRDDAESLPSGWSFLLGGDFNIRDSSEAAYVELVGSQANNAGRFRDPIKTPGSWNNNFSFRFVHTQDPSGAGGMDDRYDQILLSRDLTNGREMDYIGDATIPYSTTTWNDANHSYRAWGNDGSSYNTSLTISGNSMVGPTIAQALVDTTTAGHLPVFLDIRVPAEISSETVLDFGQVAVGSVAELTLNVSNAGDVALWGANGIDDLDYSMTTTAGFTAPAGSFVAVAGAGANAHTVSMDTSTVGVLNGTLTIASDAVDEPVRLVTLTGEVVDNNCVGDIDNSGVVDLTDLAILLANFDASPADPNQGDLDGNNAVDLTDLAILLANFDLTCP
ncbi:MAG: choice-of-anchor D domain-containing protein, partial [Planctomycetota bacterium]